MKQNAYKSYQRIQIKKEVEHSKFKEWYCEMVNHFNGLVFIRNFKIIFCYGKEIELIFDDGKILRKSVDQVDLIYKDQQKYQINEGLMSIEFVKNFQWQGRFGENEQKIGNWNAFWKGESLQYVGGLYCIRGKKQNKWVELIKNSRNQGYQVGRYQNDMKIGKWEYIYKDIQIGGGNYNGFGIKNGKWIELSENFQLSSQVIYIGDLRNGKKSGQWDIYYKKPNEFSHYELIGGGVYDVKNQKNGLWIELSEGFYSESQVIYKGQYKNGKKVGKWDIFYQKFESKRTDELIGGGIYSQQNQKDGKWLEESHSFFSNSQVIYRGQYDQGNKIGRWIIEQRLDENKPFKQIGGGSYDKENHKTGAWIELKDEFNNDSSVTYYGEYLNDKKIGKWEIFAWHQQMYQIYNYELT
ncbi:unnamed protein product [Paramecium sonneborni]|uniref:Uncharacterized protein n=1 Tax=Paramecium sonneborni TaxID=65129 RepID=A0A8S1RV32_9CILI|nr:unnamed protein product [Paramecium sonneborni]